MMIRRGAPAVILAVVLLTGCAGADPAAAPAGGPAPGSSTTATDPADAVGKTAPVDPGSVGSSPADPGSGGKPGAEGTQTLTGTVSNGVEPGCLILTGATGTHQLIISDAAARNTATNGASVTVVGKADPRMMTTCQQGTPFIVSQIRPN